MLMHMQKKKKVNENCKEKEPEVTTSRLAHTAEVSTVTGEVNCSDKLIYVICRR
jgi:hypothetical protein